MKAKLSYFFSISLLFFTIGIGFSQASLDLTPQNGDYKSVVGGSSGTPLEWTSPSTWEIYDGSAWTSATSTPVNDFSGNVFISSNSFVSFTVTSSSSGFNIGGVIIDGNLRINVPANANTSYIIQTEVFELNNDGVFRSDFGNNPQLSMIVNSLFRINGGQLNYQGGGNNAEFYIDCRGNAEINGGLVINATNQGLNNSGLYMSGDASSANPQHLKITSSISTEARRRFFATGNTYVVEEYAGEIEQNTVFGEVSSPRSGYIGFQNKSSNLNLVINNSSSEGVNLSRSKTINDSIFLQNGTLSYNSNTFTLGNNATIVRTAGEFESAPVFGSSVNLVYAEHDQQIETFNEIPTDDTVLNNLRIDNPLGVKATSDFQVNGEINLAVANPNNDIGLLEMTNDYSNYASFAYGSSGFNDPSNSANDLDSHILFLGENASFEGPGDVTGKIKRTHDLISGFTYRMGSEHTRIRFNSTSGTEGMPDEILFVATRGANGEHIDNQNATLFSLDGSGNNEVGDRNTVKRLYQVMYKANSSLPPTTRFTLRISYDDTELNGNEKEDLITWDHHLAYNGITPHEHGRTANSTEENWVELSNHWVLYLAQEDATASSVEDENVVKYWMLSSRETQRDYEWLGAVNSNWNLVSNWSGGRVPDENADVFIPRQENVPDSPIITDESGYGVFDEDDEPTFDTEEVRMRTIELATDAMVEVEENSTKLIKLYGGPNLGGDGINYNTIANSGTFIPGQSRVEILDASGLNVETEKAVLSGTTTFYDLHLADNANVEMGSNAEIEIFNEFTFGSGVNFDVLSNPNTIVFSGENQDIVQSPSDEAFYNLKLNGSGTTNLLSVFNIHGDFTLNQDIDLTNSGFNFEGDVEQMIKSDSLSIISFGDVQVNATLVKTEVNQVEIQNLILTEGVLEAGEGQELLLQGDITKTSGFLGGLGNIEIQGVNEIENELFENNTHLGNLTINNDVDFSIVDEFSVVGDFNLKEGSIDMTEKTIEFGGNLLRENGQLKASDSTTVKFISATEQQIAEDFFEDNEVSIIENNGAGGPNLTSLLVVNRFLKANSGSIQSNGYLVMKASEERTAQIAEVGINASIEGDVEVQRFIPGRRAFRFLTPSVNTTTSIRENWQENANAWNHDTIPGFGTHITGLGEALPESADGTNGFDWQPSGNPSMFVWNNNDSQWQAVDNTDTNTLSVTDTYRINIRGSRAVTLTSNTSPTSSTIIREKGEVFTGNLNFDNDLLGIEGDFLDHESFVMIANPFHSVVDLASIFQNSSGVNKRFFYVWDPQLGGSSDVNLPGETLGGRGAFVTIDLEDENSSSSEMDKFLQPKQSFFALVVDPSELTEEEEQEAPAQEPISITFSESNKNVLEDEVSVFGETNNFSLSIKLFDLLSFNTNDTPRDLTKINFIQGGNNGYDQNDALKPANVDENLARLHSSGNLFSIEERDLPTNEEELTLYINQYNVQDYVFELKIENLPAGTNAFLNDAYTNSSFAIEEGETTYQFSVDSSVNSSIAFNRFTIVFEVETMDVNHFELDNEIQVYPNPVKTSQHQFFVSGIDLENAQISMYDLKGKEVMSLFKTSKDDSNAISLRQTKLNSGMYLVKIITSENKTYFTKLLVN